MKRSIVLAIALSLVPLWAFGQGRIDAFSVGVETDYFGHVDLGTNSLYRTNLTSRYQFSVQHFADWVDDNWALLMPGTNIENAAYNESNLTWEGLGNMPGTNIENAVYDSASKTWEGLGTGDMPGTNIFGATRTADDWDVSAYTLQMWPQGDGYTNAWAANFGVLGASTGQYAGLVVTPITNNSTAFQTFNWLDAYIGRLETRLGRALDLDYVGLYSRSNNAVSPAPGWTAPCKDNSLTNGVWYTWNSLWSSMNTNFMSLGSAEMYTRNANVINIPSNTLYVVYAWAASTGVRANVGLYGADISGLTNVAYGEADFYSVGSEDYAGNQAVMASWVGASPANSNLVFTPVVAFFGPLGVITTNAAPIGVVTSSVNKLSIRVQKIGMADATLY